MEQTTSQRVPLDVGTVPNQPPVIEASFNQEGNMYFAGPGSACAQATQSERDAEYCWTQDGPNLSTYEQSVVQPFNENEEPASCENPPRLNEDAANQYESLPSQESPLSFDHNGYIPPTLYPLPFDEDFGYQYDYGQQQGYPPPYYPSIPVYFDNYFNKPEFVYPALGMDYSQNQQFINDMANAQQSGWQVYTQNPAKKSFSKNTKPRVRRQLPTQRPNGDRLPLNIINTPSNTLTKKQKSEYDIFKQECIRQIGNQASSPITEEIQEVFKRVLNHFAIYAGIPSYVNYILGEFDGQTLHPREFPSQPESPLTNTIEQIRETAEKVKAYYESMEWDRTSGWSPLERISLIDADALTIAQPKPSKPISKVSIDTIYVVLMHDIPDMQVKETEGLPIPCLETMGDILEVITDEKKCRIQATQTPVITHKWRGEIPLCGLKTENGRSRAMIIRGRQDVCQIYRTIHRKEKQSDR